MKRLMLMATAMSLCWIAPSYAQTCAGGSSFGGAPLQVGFGGDFASSSKLLSATFGVGSETPFLKIGLLRQSFSDLDSSSKSISIGVGADLAVDQSKKIYVCPIVGFTHTSGPSFPATVGIPAFDVSANTWAFGSDVGLIATKIDQMSIVPTIALTFLHSSGTSTFSAGSATVDVSAGDWYGTLAIGAGLLLSDRISVIPAIVLPFGVETGSENSFSIFFTVNFGQ
jgi:hypothetical protein